MALRQFDFIVGPETPTLPTVSAPTGGDDLVTVNYADANYEALRETGVANILNNQGAAQDVTGLLLNNANELAAVIHYYVARDTDTNNTIQVGSMYAGYNPETSAWGLESTGFVEDGGVIFSITAGGQVQYTSDDLAGSFYDGTVRWLINRWGV